mmetsp:Transcript_63652/g.170243  ORF Transcript_63652/g.170243 Transcript_63652/m.170243 type:complete len:268 (-) Transcript_63652:89-892(-)
MAHQRRSRPSGAIPLLRGRNALVAFELPEGLPHLRPARLLCQELVLGHPLQRGHAHPASVAHEQLPGRGRTQRRPSRVVAEERHCTAQALVPAALEPQPVHVPGKHPLPLLNVPEADREVPVLIDLSYLALVALLELDALPGIGGHVLEGDDTIAHLELDDQLVGQRLQQPAEAQHLRGMLARYQVQARCHDLERAGLRDIGAELTHPLVAVGPLWPQHHQFGGLASEVGGKFLAGCQCVHDRPQARRRGAPEEHKQQPHGSLHGRP